MDPLAILFTQSASSDFEAHAKTLLAATEANLAQTESQMKDLAYLAERDRSLIATLKLVLAPIRRLPAELLVHIFRDTVDIGLGGDPKSHAQTPFALRSAGRSELHAVLRLCGVCPAWRRLILRTPRLWTMQLPVSKNKSGEYAALLNVLLDRSFPFAVPVHIRSDLSPAVVDALFRVAPRWRSVLLDQAGFDELDGLPVAPPLPLLEAVSLNDELEHKSSIFQYCARLVAVRLHTAHARHFPMPWAQITRLDLSDCDAQTSLDIVIQCAALEFLRLQLLPWEVPPRGQTTATTLPHVCEMDLTLDFTTIDADQHSLSPFFARLALPKLKVLTIWFEDNAGEAPSPQSSAFELFLQRCPAIECLRLGGSSLDGTDLAAILRQIPSLVTLKLERCYESLDDTVLEQLTYIDTDPSPLVPRLEVLEYESYEGCLGYRCGSDIFLGMVRSRWWSDDVLRALAGAPPVACLSRVEIEPGNTGSTYEFGRFVGFEEENFADAVIRAEGLNVFVA